VTKRCLEKVVLYLHDSPTLREDEKGTITLLMLFVCATELITNSIFFSRMKIWEERQSIGIIILLSLSFFFRNIMLIKTKSHNNYVKRKNSW